MGRKGLLSKLNALMEPAPSSADPEDLEGWDGSSAADAVSANRDSDEDEIAQTYLPSKLRADADMNEEWGEKYGSKKVSRKQLQQESSDDEELDDAEDDEVDELDDDDDDEEEEEEEEEEELDDEDDDEDDEEEIDDEEEVDDVDDMDDDDEIDPKLRKVEHLKQVSPFVGVGEVDKELDELDKQDQDNKTTRSLMSQQERAIRAKALVTDFDTMLEVRISLQQVMSVANKLVSVETAVEDVEARRQASKHLQHTIRHLCTLREDLRCSHGREQERSSHVIDNAPRKRNHNQEDGEEEKEEGVDMSEDILLGEGSLDSQPSSEDKEVKLDQVWNAIDSGFKRCRPFWEDTLEIWQRRAQIGGAAVAKHKFKIVNRNVFDQATAALQDRPRALKRAHPMKTPETQPAEGEAPKSSTLDMSVFDDTIFYHSLLKDFLESRNNSTDHAEAVMAAAAKRRKTKHNGVDTRATKGRKIRYEALPKLENFMFPSNQFAPPLNVDELFNSLFGHKSQ